MGAPRVRNAHRGRPIHYAAALVACGIGDRERTLDWLERGERAGDTSIPFLPLERRFSVLQGEPRFQAIVARIRESLP